MADQLTNTTTNAAIIPEVWSARFFKVLLAELPFIDSVNYDYQNEIQSMGDIVNISTMPEFDQATLLAEGAAGDADAVTITGQQLTIDSRGYKDVKITREAQLQSLSFMDELREKMIYAINKKIQADIIAKIAPSTSAPDHVVDYDSGTTLALADILEVKELLDTQNVASDGRTAVLGAAQLNDVFNITGYASSDFRPAGSPAPLSSGMFEFPLAGFNIKSTTIVGNTSYWFHPSFLTVAIQDSLRINTYDMGVDGVRATRVNADILYGIKQLDNTRVVTLS